MPPGRAARPRQRGEGHPADQESRRAPPQRAHRLAEEQRGRGHPEDRDEQGERGHRRGRVVAQQEAPGPEAEDGGDPRDVDDDCGPAPVERGQGVGVAVPALEDEGEAEQREHGHGRYPHHEVEGVGRGGLAGQHVGHTPAGRRRDHQDEGEHGPARALVDRRHRDARESHPHPQHPYSARSFTEGERREESREDRLDLEHEGGETGGHPAVHADEEQPELRHSEDEPDADDPLPGDLGPADEEDRGQRGDQEAQGGEEQRREVPEADLDDDEIDTPDGGHQGGQGDVEGTHAPRITRADHVAPARIPSWWN